MKQDEFLDLMNGVSEEYIAEMMDHRQMQPISPDKEITMMKNTDNTNGKQIRINRRTVAAGSAVAAALLALNVGGIILLHHNAENMQANTSTASGQDITSDFIEEVTSELPAVTEPEPAETPLPAYVEYMRQYYEGISAESCDYDYTKFIGLGTDLNETWEDENYKVTVKAAVGCDWIIYYFFDVEVKCAPEDAVPWSKIVRLVPEGNAPKGDVGESADCIDMMPGTDDDDWRNTIWHFYGVISNTTDQPFFHCDGQPVSKDFRFFTWDHSEHTSQPADIAVCTLDFSGTEYPLLALAQPHSWSDLARRPDDMMAALTAAGHGPAFTMTRYAETPFGLYYISDPQPATDWWSPLSYTLSSGYWLEGNFAYQTDADGNQLRSFRTMKDTLYGLAKSDDYEMGFLCATFGQPLNLEQGPVALMFSEQEPWPNSWETGVNEDGLTYGQAFEMVYNNEEYDLVFMTGDNGNAGYAYVSDLTGTECFALPEELEGLPEDAETVTVNVYRKDGKTLIDTATVRKIN